MGDVTRKTGHCACGAVTFTAGAPDHYGVCHCGMCRRWAGGPMMAVNCGTDVAFSGDVAIWVSSEWAERGHCGACGTVLFYRLRDSGQHYMVLGAFDDQDGWTMDSQIFVDRKPAHYEFANETKRMTEAEVFATVAAGQTPD